MLIKKMKTGNAYYIETATGDMYIIKRYNLVWVLEQFDIVNLEYSAVCHSDTLGTLIELILKGEFEND